MFFGRDKEIDVDQLREQLIIDEGQVNEIYHDHLGYATFGIGHLVIEGDPEYGLPVGTPVAEDRVITCFEKDVETVIDDYEPNKMQLDKYRGQRKHAWVLVKKGKRNVKNKQK